MSLDASPPVHKFGDLTLGPDPMTMPDRGLGSAIDQAIMACIHSTGDGTRQGGGPPAAAAPIAATQ
jgi:hypothetical protein